jgi:hypothetical protein
VVRRAISPDTRGCVDVPATGGRKMAEHVSKGIDDLRYSFE